MRLGEMHLLIYLLLTDTPGKNGEKTYNNNSFNIDACNQVVFRARHLTSHSDRTSEVLGLGFGPTYLSGIVCFWKVTSNNVVQEAYDYQSLLKATFQLFNSQHFDCLNGAGFSGHNPVLLAQPCCDQMW